MRFGISVNMDIPDAPRLAKKTMDCLKGHEVLLENEVAARLKMAGMAIDDMDVDFIITVGGDGTMLRALHHNTAPIFGVNAGDLGFPHHRVRGGAGGGHREHPQWRLQPSIPAPSSRPPSRGRGSRTP